MGIVQKSSFRSSFLLGIGILLGFVTSGLLLPNYLSPEENGLLTLLNSYSLIYSQIAVLGMHTAVIKFYPHFKDEKNKHQAFLSVMGVLIFISFMLFVGYYYISKPYLKAVFEKSPLFGQNYFYLLPLTFFTLYFYLFDSFSTAQVKSVRGFFLKDVVQRVLILLAILAYIFYQIQFSYFVLLYVVAVCLPTVFFLGILISEKQVSLRPRWTEMYQKNWRYMAKVSGYSMLLGLSWVGINNIDAIMVERILNLEQAGIYGRNMFFGVLVALPYRAIHKISSGVISGSFKDGNLENIKDVYYKSSLNQTVLGAFILLGIWLNIGNVYQIIPMTYEPGKYVILFIGLGNFFTMLGGVNTAVISFSPYYKWNTWFVGALLILVIASNLLFIPLFGVTGAALATATSIFMYNLMMFVLLLVKYKFQPFNLRHLGVLAIAGACYLGCSYIPVYEPSFIIDIILRSGIFTLLFGSIILITRISPDINSMMGFVIKKVFFFLPKNK